MSLPSAVPLLSRARVRLIPLRVPVVPGRMTFVPGMLVLSLGKI